MNFRKMLGKIIRYLLRFIPRDFTFPILQGRARGMKWIVGSHTHGCWLGSYERKIRLKWEGAIKAGGIVYDVGAHVGYYSLLASRLTGPSGKVFSFEPLPRNLLYLRKHLAINNLTNVTVVESAISDSSGTQSFNCGNASSMGGLAIEGGGLKSQCHNFGRLCFRASKSGPVSYQNGH